MTFNINQLKRVLSKANLLGAFILGTSLLNTSCNQDDILENGSELGDGSNVKVCFEDNFSLRTTTKFFRDSILTSSVSNAIVGEIQEGDLGTTKSSVYLRPNVSSGVAFNEQEEFVGFEFLLVFNGYSYGDTLSAIEFQGRELETELEIIQETVDQSGDTIIVSVPRYHFEIIPENSIGNELLRFDEIDEEVLFADLDIDSFTNSSDGTTSERKFLRIPMDETLGRQLFSLDTISDSTVIDLFKGIALDIVDEGVYYGIDGSNSKFRLLYNDRDENGDIITEDVQGIIRPKEFTYDMSIAGFYNSLFDKGDALASLNLGDTLSSVSLNNTGLVTAGTPIYSVIDFDGALELLNRAVEEGDDNPLTKIIVQRAELSISAVDPTDRSGTSQSLEYIKNNTPPPSQIIFATLTDELENDGQISRLSDGSISTLFTEAGDAALSSSFSIARNQYGTIDITSYFNARLNVLNANNDDNVDNIESGDFNYAGPMVVLPTSISTGVNKLTFPDSESDALAPSTGLNPNVPLNLNLRLYYTIFGGTLECGETTE
ncbi:DUF4270 family protein [Sediminitomix flava]|uniref:Uncharacterized protein DUF4270 n=1 Tax=Sediminitomix flava TaxID=379075 RepID=A0A315Z9U9_SEDFL|nr:DUF4270 family protein [Sediminitomix flava]PWJ42052.1 uncharacterized protein DUF4270 [Sediminitomix flava]